MLSAELQQAVAEYAELDMEIGRLVAERFYDVCAACRKRCCKPEVCEQALDSWWLRQVSEHVHGKWWPDDWEGLDECVAMTAEGCLLQAGRPIICRSFVCDRYVEAYADIWEVIFYSFISDLPWEVGQLSSRVGIETLGPDNAPRYAGKILHRLAEARGLLAEAKGLLDPSAGEGDKHRIALKLLAAVPRFLRATTRRALLVRLGGSSL